MVASPDDRFADRQPPTRSRPTRERSLPGFRAPARPLLGGAGPLLALALCAACPSRPSRPSLPSADDVSATPTSAWLAGVPEREDARPIAGGSLIVRAMTEPVGLNTLDDGARDAWTFRMTRNLIYESLLEIDPVTLALRPQLALSWRESEDHRVTTFALRRGVLFHDGTSFGAEDVVAAFDAIQNPARPCASLRADFDGLERWRALDAHTIELTWSRPSPFALRKLAHLPLLSAEAIQGDWSSASARPVGTGPFRFASWERGTRLTFVRNEAWWGGRPHLDRVAFHVVKDHTVAAALFEQGAFDLMTAIAPTLWRAMERGDPRFAWAHHRWRRLRSVDNSYSYVAWNQNNPLLADLRVRRALARLYPSELISRAVDLGLERPTTCPFWLEGESCDSASSAIVFDPQLARSELVAAGFADDDGDGVLERDGLPLRFRFLMPASSVRLAKVFALLQEQGRLAGVDLVPETADIATMSARVARRDFDAVSRVWTEFDSEVDQFPMFHSSQRDAGSNLVNYASADTDALLEVIRGEWDVARRRDLERELHRRLYQDQPYLFMTARQSLDAAKVKVRGLSPSLVWYDLRRVWITP
jgi:peptide/nickel transport system substrate-binding protein